MILTKPHEKQYSVQSFRLRYKCSIPPPATPLTTPGAVTDVTRAVFGKLDGGLSVEHFGAWFLNSQSMIIGFKAFNTGTVDQVAVYPRMIIHTALMVGAAALVLVHNHPSGITEPSEEDKRLTKTLVDAGRFFDMRVVDHIIIGQDKHFSFVERGLI